MTVWDTTCYSSLWSKGEVNHVKKKNQVERMSVSMRKISNHVAKEHGSNQIYDSDVFFHFSIQRKIRFTLLTIAIFFLKCQVFLFITFHFFFKYVKKIGHVTISNL